MDSVDARMPPNGANRKEQLKLPFDQHQRYKVVAEVLEVLREDSAPLRILDVGGGEGIVLSFLPEGDVTVLDQTEAEEVPGFVKGDATALPFEDESFDYVMSVDVYEHIEPEHRDRYLSELRRAARKGVLLASPFDSEGVRDAEELANEVHRIVHRQENVWLKEHAENGLPDLDETRKFFEERRDQVTVVPNGYLPNWLAMISLTFYSSKLGGETQKLFERLNTFYNEFMYRQDNAEPCYRHLLVSLKDGRRPGFEHVISGADNSHAFRVAFSSAFSATLPLASMLETLDGQLAQKDGQLAQREVQVRDLSRRLAQQMEANSRLALEKDQLAATTRQKEKRIAALTNQNANLVAQRERFVMSRSWRLLTLLSRQRRRVMALLGRRSGSS